MGLKTEIWTRNPFDVEAIQVTEENIEAVAAWCSGEIQRKPSTGSVYIKANVTRPVSKKQTEAYVGDWVLYAGSGFKIYTDSAFRNSFHREVQKANRPLPPGVTAGEAPLVLHVEGSPGPIQNAVIGHATLDPNNVMGTIELMGDGRGRYGAI